MISDLDCSVGCNLNSWMAANIRRKKMNTWASVNAEIETANANSMFDERLVVRCARLFKARHGVAPSSDEAGSGGCLPQTAETADWLDSLSDSQFDHMLSMWDDADDCDLDEYCRSCVGMCSTCGAKGKLVGDDWLCGRHGGQDRAEGESVEMI